MKVGVLPKQIDQLRIDQQKKNLETFMRNKFYKRKHQSHYSQWIVFSIRNYDSITKKEKITLVFQSALSHLGIHAEIRTVDDSQ